MLATFAFVIFPASVLAAPNWLTSQYAYPVCEYPYAKIYVYFKNEEPNHPNNAMLVTATNVESNKTLDLGRVEAGATASGYIIPNIGTDSDQLAAGTVRFDLKWANNRWGTDVRYASFTGVTCNPTAVIIEDFKAFAKNSNKVIVTWKSGSENNLAGFNVWRSIKELNGPVFKDPVKVTGSMIQPKTPGSLSGNSYKVVDDKVKPGRVYKYKMEVIGVNGQPIEHTKDIKVKVPQVGEPPL